MELGNAIFGNSRGEFEADRGLYESIFGQIFVILDIYTPFENDIFEIFPYYWGDCTCGCNEEQDEPHKENCLLVKPNFVYKPTGFSIQWYKYPFRDSYANMDLEDKELVKIAHHCVGSILENM